jgi:hypothetical protein
MKTQKNMHDAQENRPHLKIVKPDNMDVNQAKEGPVPRANRDMVDEDYMARDERHASMMEKAEGDEDIVDEALRNAQADQKTEQIDQNRMGRGKSRAA